MMNAARSMRGIRSSFTKKLFTPSNLDWFTPLHPCISCSTLRIPQLPFSTNNSTSAKKKSNLIERILKNYFPDPIYEGFIFVQRGVKQTLRDRVQYKEMRAELNKGRKLESFTHREQEQFHLMRKDIQKMIPIIIAAFAPFGWVYFPIALVFARTLLPHQFLSKEQLAGRDDDHFGRRVTHQRHLVRHLAAPEPRHSGTLGVTLLDHWTQLEEGKQMTAEEVLTRFGNTFSESPYCINSLRQAHLMCLCKSHCLLPWVSSLARQRLRAETVQLKALDKALRREGIDKLSEADLIRVCRTRGLGKKNLSAEDLRNWLTCWIDVSAATSRENCSLLLHLPVLLHFSSPVWMKQGLSKDIT